MTPDSHTLVDSAPDRKDALQMAEEQLVRLNAENIAMRGALGRQANHGLPDPTGITPGTWIAQGGAIFAHNEGAAPICITEVLRSEDAQYLTECVKFVRGE